MVESGLYDWLTDEELEAEEKRLRDRAHDAKHQNAAARGEEWMKAKTELDRRKAHRQ